MQERSKKILRQFKRYLGTEDAEKAIVQWSEKANGSENSLSFLENFSKFVDAIENSYNEYEDRLKVATRNIELSSRELTTAYANLESLNTNINAMLDSLGQGLLFFDSEGICSPTYSKACLELLEIDPSHMKLPDVLHFSAIDKENFDSWLNIVFSDTTALDFDDMKRLLPSHIVNVKGDHIELDYKPMYLHENALIGILLIATDISYKLETEEKMIHIQTEAHRIQQIAQNRNGFHRFLCDIYNFIDTTRVAEDLPITSEERNVIMRQLHTYKGNASAFSLDAFSAFMHDLESRLRLTDNGEFMHFLKSQIDETESLLDECKIMARNLFGPDFMTQGKVLNIEVSRIHEFSGLITKTVKSAEERDILNRTLLRDFLSFPIFSAFLSFERELTRMAEQQGKPIPVCRLTGDNLPIVYSDYENFFNVLIHLARNIIDHGIEKPEDRAALGKSMEGQILINIQKKGNDKFIISIGDDGRGIDPGKIRHKLRKETNIDLSEKSDEELLQYVFQPDFSLKAETTMVSGRGIGMDAIRDIVTGMGGNAKVESADPDRPGTRFIFELPYRL